MNKLLISVFAACLASIAPAAVCAQQLGHPPAGGGHPAAPSHPVAAPRAMHSAPRPASAFHRSVTRRPTTVHRTTMIHRATVNHHITTHVTAGRSVREPTHAHIDINSYHKNITAERRFHYGEYRAPRGYEYRRWSYGENLPQEYYAQGFWITNYLNFGLPWTPDGCEWVRYGPDALLVDVDTGQIVQVEYGVFY